MSSFEALFFVDRNGAVCVRIDGEKFVGEDAKNAFNDRLSRMCDEWDRNQERDYKKESLRELANILNDVHLGDYGDGWSHYGELVKRLTDFVQREAEDV